MSSNHSPTHTPQLKFKHLFWAGLLLQLLAIPDLWGQVSSEPVLLGRYSLRYSSILVVFFFITFGYAAAAFIYYVRIERFVAAMRPRHTLGVVFAAIGASFAVQFISVDPQIQAYIVANSAFISVIVILGQSGSLISPKRYHWMGVLALLLMVPLFLTNLVALPFNPDEALWAEFASTFLMNGSLHYRTGFATVPIEPGLGWVTALYGLLLEGIAFDIRLGRAIIFINALLTILGIGWIARRLYGARVGWVSALIAFFSLVPFDSPDYRPDKFVVLGQIIAFAAVIYAHQSTQPWLKIAAHFFAGLTITMSMQLHASAIGFIVGLSLFYTGSFIISVYQAKHISRSRVMSLLSFGLGAGLGTSVYFVFNIAVVGGTDDFLAMLINARGQSFRRFLYFTGWDLLTTLILLSTFGFMIWRKNESDRLYLGLWICSLIGILALDNQGYFSPYLALMLVPAGLIIHILGAILPGKQHNQITLAVVCILIITTSNVVQFVDWRTVQATVRTGELPEHPVMPFTAQVAEFAEIREDDAVASTHELIWAIPYHGGLYSLFAEEVAEIQRGWVGTRIWEIIEPTLYIEIERRYITPDGLRQYLDENGFQVCDETVIGEEPIRIFRQVCSRTS